MSFSAKIVLADHVKEDGTQMVYLQAYIDRQRATVPLGFYVSGKDFDLRKQRMKPTHKNAKDFDSEFMIAIAKANTIASQFRQKELLLTPEAFRKSYTDPTEKMDLIKFMEKELELKKPSIQLSTYRSHNTVINRLRKFKSSILFNQINRELIQQIRNKLIEKGSGVATIEKHIKILKMYINEARKKGISVREIDIKIKSFTSNRTALSEAEVLRLDKYYESVDCPDWHRNVLRYFLFSCYTGLRISDIKVLTWQNINGDMLTYMPEKTKSKNSLVNVPLLDHEKKYLPPYTNDKALVFKTYADQVNNRHLKKIADHIHVKIKKKVTYHTSRHTFASLMAETGDIVSVQKMLGHGDIKTSMGYVHTSTKQLIEAKRARFAPELKTQIPMKEESTK